MSPKVGGCCNFAPPHPHQDSEFRSRRPSHLFYPRLRSDGSGDNPKRMELVFKSLLLLTSWYYIVNRTMFKNVVRGGKDSHYSISNWKDPSFALKTSAFGDPMAQGDVRMMGAKEAENRGRILFASSPGRSCGAMVVTSCCRDFLSREIERALSKGNRRKR